jgi:hypothetical protein
MKKLFNKYCDFIGVENDGLKRILIISILCLTIINFNIFYQPIENVWKSWGYWDGNKFYIFSILIILPPISSIITMFEIGFFIKTFNWVKDGYSK